MAQAIKANDVPGWAAEKAARKQAKQKRVARGQAMGAAEASFDGKVFADLTGGEKDDLLKALAISAGFIAE